MHGGPTPRRACAAVALRPLLMLAAFAAFWAGDELIPASQAQKSSSASPADNSASGPTLDSLIGVLHANGFTAKRIETAAPFAGGIETHLTGFPDIKVQLMALPCKEPGISICYLGFVTSFPRAPVFTPETLTRLDLLTMAHVFQHSDGRGSNILLFEYTYACRGIEDPKFALMVLRYFTAAVRQVSSTLKELGGAGTVPAMPDPTRRP
jgi:hypothetical protein